MGVCLLNEHLLILSLYFAVCAQHNEEMYVRKSYLKLKQRKSRITKTLHQDVNGCLEMILEVRVRQTVAVQDEFQRQLRVDEHLVQMIAVVSRVVHLRKLARKRLHL